MSLNKAVEHGKEKRKPYYRYCEQIDRSCRCHGGCEWCLGNRLINKLRREEAMKQEEKWYENRSYMDTY